jgi:hypothetical protein
MNRQQANIYLATILTTVAEMGEAPSGHLYAGLMGRMNLDDYNMLIGICKGGSLMTESNHVLTLTAKGQEMVKKINETLKTG